jgi:hypothetical protein
MKPNLMFLFFSFVSSVFGVSFFVFPTTVLAMYGSDGSAGEVQLVRIIGALTLGYVVLALSSLKISDTKILRKILLTFLIPTFLTFCVFGYGILSGEDAGLPAWVNVGLFAAYFLGFGYSFLITK